MNLIQDNEFLQKKLKNLNILKEKNKENLENSAKKPKN